MAQVVPLPDRRTGKRAYRVRYRTPDRRQTDKPAGSPPSARPSCSPRRWRWPRPRASTSRPSLGRVTVGRAGQPTGWPASSRRPPLALPDAGVGLACTRHPAVGGGEHRPTSTSSAWRRGSREWSARVRCDHGAAGARCAIGHPGRRGEGQRLASNPAKGVENLPRKTARRRVYLSAGDVDRLADESGEHRALVLTLAYTGIRWGEAVALRVRDVQFLRRRLSVHANAVQIGVVTRSGRRRAARPDQCPCPRSCSTSCRCSARARPPDELVFGRTAGSCPGPNRPADGSPRAVKHAGVQPITPHDLRHTCASRALRGRQCLRCRMLGHKSAMTLDTYAGPVRRRPGRRCRRTRQGPVAGKG